MKQKLSILAGGLIAFYLPLQTHAQDQDTHALNSLTNTGDAQVMQGTTNNQNGTDGSNVASKAGGPGTFGPSITASPINEIEVKNFKGETLGRIRALAVDLPHGSIVEVLVVSDQFLGMGGKTVGVPPEVLMQDAKNEVYQIDMSAETFKAAPAFNLNKWADSTTTDQVAAVYRYFGQAPTFLITGEAPGRKTIYGVPVTNLGVLEKQSHLINMPVDNLQGVRLGTIASMTMDVPKGAITGVILRNPEVHISSMAKLATSGTVLAPTLFSFNAARNGLLLDLSQDAYNAKPNVIDQDGAGGETIRFREQVVPAAPTTSAAPAQGSNSTDINTTVQIYQSIKSSNLDAGAAVQVATLNGRVTLRGPVNNQATKDSIGAIAVAAVSSSNVDNQIVVAMPLQASM